MRTAPAINHDNWVAVRKFDLECEETPAQFRPHEWKKSHKEITETTITI